MRKIYTLLYMLGLPFILLRLWIKGFQHKGYRERVGERLGKYQKKSQRMQLWIHAVSVGESITAIPLIQHIQKQQPDWKIVVTTTTVTGSQIIRERLQQSVQHVYMPYDIPFIVRRFLKRFRPQVCGIMETELWPNTLHCCKQASIPVVIMNARLSPQSMQGYLKIKKITRHMLLQITQINAQSRHDAERFMQLGLPEKNCRVLGNMKFEISPSEHIIKRGQAWKNSCKNRPVLLAASTHPGEEAIIIKAYQQLLQQSGEPILLILVPRHVKNTQAILEKHIPHDMKTQLRSQSDAIDPDTHIFVVDVIGQLLDFYAFADSCFVGGSLVPVGGHNLLEPAAYRCPIITGPHLHNFQVISQLLQEQSAISIVHNAEQLAEKWKEHLSQNHDLEQQKERGFSIIKKNQGALHANYLALTDCYHGL